MPRDGRSDAQTAGSGHFRRHSWLVALTALAVVLALYFTAPLVPAERNGSVGWVRAVGVVVALIVLAAVAFRLVRPAIEQGWYLRERLAVLVVVVGLVAVAFAAGAVLMSEQFEGLETKVDGLYFALVSLTTVGYGDITPVGQAARLLVTAQVAFNLVVVTTAISVLGSGRAASGGRDE